MRKFLSRRQPELLTARWKLIGSPSAKTESLRRCNRWRENPELVGASEERVCLWQILLQKPKIERPGESRESRFLDAPAVARLSGANTKVGGRFGMNGCGPSCHHARNASAVFKIFVLHPKKTFATISALFGHALMSALSLLSGVK